MKSVLITGGTGTFGHALVARLIHSDSPPDRIVIYSRDEQKQEDMRRRLGDGPLRYFIGDVRDAERLAMAMRGIETVFHAAALKIVPIAEYNPFETIMTNVHGAENVIRAAIRTGVSQVIALSTDKAVAPVNLYGASKLCAEKLFIAANNLAAGSCYFSVVRYGNVVGSRGSVVPLFRRLAGEGKPFPITDRRMTRFWITIDQAIDFVLSCQATGMGRVVFVPKLPSVRIMDLVEAINPSAITEHVGIRPGEKLHESLISADEAYCTYDDEDRYVILQSAEEDMHTVGDGFSYTSGNNTQWLTVNEIRNTIGG